MKQTILFIALLFSFNIIFADNTPDTNKTDAFLVGHVISNGSHISNVIINIMGTNITTTTNYTGHYEIPNAPVGQLTIIAQSMGFLSQEKIININSNQTIELNFELQSDLINLDQVVVSSDKTDRNRAQDPVLVNVISPKLFASTGAVCSAEILNFQPGLRIENNCQNCGFNQLRINGMEGHYTQILINSCPIFSALNGVYGLEQIPAQMIDRIEIVRGGGSALFGGNAIAGTVNIITKDPVNNSFQLNSTFSAINGNTPDYNLGFNTSVVSDDLKSGLFIFGIKRSRNAFFANEDDFSELPLIKSNSFGFSAFYKITSQIKISADFHNLSEFRRGGNKFDYMPHLADIAEQVDHDINGGGVNFDFLSKNYNSKFSAFISGQITYRQSYYGAELNPAAYGNTNDVSVVSGLQFSHNFKDVFFIPIKIVSGVGNIRTSLIDKKLAYVDDDNILQPERIIVNQQLNTKGAFIQSEINYDKIKIMLGARYDIPDDNLQIQPVFMPRLNLLVNIIKQSKIRLSFARGYRAPQVFDEDLHIETSAARQVIHLNSEDLTAEFSNSFSGSIDYVLYKNDVQIYFLADFFYTILQNPFANEFVFNENDKILTSYRTNSESGAYVQGVNLETKIALSKKFELQIGGTIQKSMYVEPQTWSDDETMTTNFFTKTPNSYGYAVIYFNPFENTSISLLNNYTGSMLVPHFAGGFDNNGNLIETDELVKTDDFFEFGFNFSQSFKITNQFKIQFNAGVKNIFNSYQNDFDIGINRDAGYIYGPLLPRTFTFGFKLGRFI